MLLLIIGTSLLASIIFLFWLKDKLESPILARIVYSGLVARLAVAGAVITVIGALMILGDLTGFNSSTAISHTKPDL